MSNLQSGSGNAHAYYHCDGNGNVTALINASGQVVARYLYDPFGNTLSAAGPLADANLYRFSSKELHAASGLVYYLYRFYDPGLQRWVSRDPFREAGTEILLNLVPTLRFRFFDAALNLIPDVAIFLFVSNDPIFVIDPNGKWPKKLDKACELCFVTPAMAQAINDYNDALRRLHQRYGDNLPDWVDTFMDEWKKDLVSKFGSCVVSPIAETVPGTTTTGPVIKPKR